jgi:large subunit ribosomal protein L29
MAKTRLTLIKELKDQMREAPLEEVRAKARELEGQLAKLRFQLAAGQTDTVRKIRELRRDVARLKTIVREREIAAAPTGPAVR